MVEQVVKVGAITWLIMDGIGLAWLMHASKHAPYMTEDGRIIPTSQPDIIDLRDKPDNVIDLRDHIVNREEVNA